jgi:hypothetical protein
MNSKDHQFYAKDHRKNVKWHSEAWSLAQEKANPPLKTRRDLKEAFWRTLASDIELTTHLASPSLRKLYES